MMTTTTRGDAGRLKNFVVIGGRAISLFACKGHMHLLGSDWTEQVICDG